MRKSTVIVFLFYILMTTFNASQAFASGLPFDAQAPEIAYGTTVKYGIFRNGKSVGEHTVEFQQTDSGLQVLVESRIVVTILKVPVFKFNYRAEERWQEGKLISVETAVTEKGKTKRASLMVDGTEQTVIDTDGNRTIDSLAYASNHWHPGVLTSDRLFNTLTGRASRYTLSEVETQILSVSDSKINSTRYRYGGDFNSDVWYDMQGRWVQLQFSADDGSTIEYRLTQPFTSGQN